MRIAVRLDDINPRMDYRKFCKVKAMLDKYRVCPLLGVVPDNRDKGIEAGEEIQGYDKMLVSLKDSGWVIAMHGVTHKYLSVKDNKSEFCGINYKEQYEMLKRGKETLEKQIEGASKVFFAPSNNHDRNTEKALKRLGFSHISYGENNHIYKDGLLTCIPIASGIRQVGRLVRFHAKEDGVTTLVIHPNTTSEKLLGRYDRLLASCHKKRMLVNYGELLLEEAHGVNVKWVRQQRRINNLEEVLSKIKGILMNILRRHFVKTIA